MENLNFVLEKSWKSHEIYFCDLRGNPGTFTVLYVTVVYTWTYIPVMPEAKKGFILLSWGQAVVLREIRFYHSIQLYFIFIQHNLGLKGGA